MKQTLSRTEAITLLLDDEYANWTLAGARALIAYLEDLEYEQGPLAGFNHIYNDFDPVALRCGWSEYASIDEALGDYGLDSFAELDLSTTVLALDTGGVVVEQF